MAESVSTDCWAWTATVAAYRPFAGRTGRATLGPTPAYRFFSHEGTKISKLTTIHVDISTKTPPLLYSSLNITKIIQSLQLTDAIIDDSNSIEDMS